MQINSVTAKPVQNNYSAAQIKSLVTGGSGANVQIGIGGDSITLSAGGRKAAAPQALQDQLRSLLEASVGAGQEAYEAAGKSDYLSSIADPTDNSPEAVAGRIFGGITSYIFGAFVNQHPDFSDEQLTKFEGQVREGVERGAGQAREILKAISVLDPELDANIDDTLSILANQLDDFFANQHNAIASRGDAAATA